MQAHLGEMARAEADVGLVGPHGRPLQERNGVLEYGTVGVLGLNARITPLLHYSITPVSTT